MRITRQILHKIAADTVAERTYSDHTILSAYLVGSLLDEEPLLGGTTDIDLVFIHTDEPASRREIVRVSNEITLDIAHYSQQEYQQPRHLRLHPWMGPSIYGNPILLYDVQHFFDFSQASVGAQFNRPDNKLARSLRLFETARNIWTTIPDSNRVGPAQIHAYLKVISCAANAFVSLSGQPITERRFLLLFPDRAQEMGRPGFTIGLLSLLGVQNITVEDLENWLIHWERAFFSACKIADPASRLQESRYAYYIQAFQSILGSEQPQAIIMPLLCTWTSALMVLPEDTPLRTNWHEACQRLELVGQNFSDRLQALDTFLDNIEEAIEEWAVENGAK